MQNRIYIQWLRETRVLSEIDGQAATPENLIRRAIVDYAKTAKLQAGEEGLDPSDDSQYLSRGEVQADFKQLYAKLASLDRKNKYGFSQATTVPALFTQIHKFVAEKGWPGAGEQLPKLLNTSIKQLKDLCVFSSNGETISQVLDLPDFNRQLAEAALLDEYGVTNRLVEMATDPGFAPIAYLIPAMMACLDPKIVEKFLSKWIEIKPSNGAQEILDTYKRLYGSDAQVSKLLKATESDQYGGDEEEKQEIVNEMTPEEVEAGAKTLRTMFESRSDKIRRSAAYSYGALSDRLGSHEIVAGARALRAVFHDESDIVREAAVNGYMAISKRISSAAEVDAGAAALRTMFMNTPMAINAYGELASRLTPREVAAGAPALRKVFKQDEYFRDLAIKVYGTITDRVTTDEAIAAVVALRRFLLRSDDSLAVYEKLIKKIPPEIVADEASALRGKIFDKSLYQHNNTFVSSGAYSITKVHVRAYAVVATRFAPERAASEAIMLHGMLTDEYIGRAVAVAYGALAANLAPNDAAAEAKTLRGMISSKSHDDNFVVINAYTNLVAKMTPEVAIDEMKAWRAMFNDKSEEVKSAAIKAYGGFSERMSPEELAGGAVTLRGMLGDVGGAIPVYAKLAQNCSTEELAFGAKALSELFKHKSKWIRESSIKAYANLAIRMGPEELTAGAKALKDIMSDKDVGDDAADGYKFLVAKMSPEIIAAEAKALRAMMGDKASSSTPLGYAYGHLVGQMTPQVVAEEASAIRAGRIDNTDDLYGILVKEMPPRVVAVEAKAVRALFNDQSRDVRSFGIELYEAMADKLAPEELAAGVKILKGMALNDRDSRVRRLAEHTLDHLTAD